MSLVALFIVGCAPALDKTDSPDSKGSATAAASTEPKTDVTSETEALSDPVEDAFTIQMPKGWHNRAYSARAYDIHRTVAYSVSPNGDTLLFAGDPSIPNYFTPEGANPMTYEFAKLNPLIKVEPFRPVTEYLPDYVKRKFGKLDGFKTGEVQTLPEVESKMMQAFANAGLPIQPSCGKISLKYNDKDGEHNAIIYAFLANSGSLFTVEVSGISTAGDPTKYEEMLENMRSSIQIKQAWKDKQNQLHQQRMAQIQAATEAMTAQHNRNMAWIQNSAARHQQRMQAIWAQNDASMDAYWQRSASSDLSHQRFLNYINDENTVVNSSGKTFQVDNSYETYFMKKSDNSYVGGDSTWDLDTLRKMGLNPDDYEQVKIRR